MDTEENNARKKYIRLATIIFLVIIHKVSCTITQQLKETQTDTINSNEH